ncbi:hypothetical protein RD792_013980 [Penstemon davidsonii]|uniref:Carbohydrate kinase PfkB domain-containing protein n=1 Tax=Penstemon davidsonii TaxID=160366 RepID=A0ABR0CN25_9LAMI|nr:hypothetical protein RD792_013980 [Penstemon davidsonii]
MATLQLLHHAYSFALNSPTTHVQFPKIFPNFSLKPRNCLPKSSTDDTTAVTTPRRGRKKSTTTTKTPKRPRKEKKESSNSENDDNTAMISKEEENASDLPYGDPPLVCCFGAAQKEFLPTVRVAPEQMHPDIYSQWKMLQWNPPEFVRAPGGPPSNVAISHVRLGGRAAFIGKVGSDKFGEEMVSLMEKEKVQTRGVKLDDNSRTACAYMKIKFKDGRMWAETVKECAEDSMLESELNLAVLKEVKVAAFLRVIGTLQPEIEILALCTLESHILFGKMHPIRVQNADCFAKNMQFEGAKYQISIFG